MVGLSAVVSACPTWFALDDAAWGGPNEVTGKARIDFPGAAVPFEIGLRIWEQSSATQVSEDGTNLLPCHCPERHINEDRSFCLAYRVEGLQNTNDGATVWWGLLLAYLGYQRVASRTGLWPAQAFISHGKAGPHHMAALEAARRLGIEELYAKVLEGHPCWIGDGSIKRTPDGSRLLNGRSACPVGCRGRRNHPLLRRTCCKKPAVLSLMDSEKHRKAAEREFWDDLKERGVTCCGTMRKCPLANLR